LKFTGPASIKHWTLEFCVRPPPWEEEQRLAYYYSNKTSQITILSKEFQKVQRAIPVPNMGNGRF